MAKRRMFSQAVVESDDFLDMSMSAQALYFHLSMFADDEGFLGNARSIQRSVGASADDLKLLQAKGYVLRFDSGVVFLPHWKLNNCIRSDRFQPTVYQAERMEVFGEPQEALPEPPPPRTEDEKRAKALQIAAVLAAGERTSL